MILLGFDLGADGACAVYDDDRVVKCYRLTIKSTQHYDSQRSAGWFDQVMPIVTEWKPDAIAYEEPNAGRARPGAHRWIHRQDAMLAVIASTFDILILGVVSTAWQACARNFGGMEKAKKGESKIVSIAGARNRGWPCESDAEADAAWVAFWLAHQEIEGAE